MSKTPATPATQAAPVAHPRGRNVAKPRVSRLTTELSSPGMSKSAFTAAIVIAINTAATAVSHRLSRYLASSIVATSLGQTKVGLVSRGIALLKSHAMIPFRGRCTTIRSGGYISITSFRSACQSALSYKNLLPVNESWYIYITYECVSQCTRQFYWILCKKAQK